MDGRYCRLEDVESLCAEKTRNQKDQHCASHGCEVAGRDLVLQLHSPLESSRDFPSVTIAVEILAVLLAAASVALLLQRQALQSIADVIEAAPDAIMVVDTNGVVREANTRFASMFGYHHGELRGKPMEVLVPEHVGAGHPQLRERFVAEGGARRMEERGAALRGVRKDGTEFPVDVSVSVVNLGTRKRVFASVRDLTPVLEAEAREHERLKALLDTSPVGVAITVDGIIRFKNPSFSTLLGLGVGDHAARIYRHAGDRDRMLERLEAQGIVRDYEVSATGADGAPRRILLTYMKTQYEGKDAVLGWAVDVTHLKEIEEELRRLNFLRDSALDLTKAGYWFIDLSDVGYYEASDRVRDLFGEAPKPDRRYHLETEWMSRIVAVDPEAGKRVTELFQGAIDGKYDQYDAEYPYKRPADGRVIWTRARAFVERDEKGRAVKMYGVQQDLTEQHSAELQLQQSEERLDAAMRGADLGLWEVRPAQDEILANEILEKQLDYPSAGLRESADKWARLRGGLSGWPQQLHPDDRDRVLEAIQRHVNGTDEVYRAEHRVRTADGKYKWILSTGRTAARDSSGRSLRVNGVHIDISAAKALEELRDALTHMIVHDLRSPLSAVLMTLELLQVNPALRGDPGAQEDLRRGMSSTQALIQMINTLLDVYKMEAGEMPLQRETADLHLAVDGAIAALGSLASERHVVVERSSTPIDLSYDRDVITRVVSNLLANAIKFTPKNGRITVRVSKSRGGSCIEVIDTGRGIPPEFHAKVFEKFGQVEARREKKQIGTGLGLTFCKLAVESHGGEIGLESEVGKGSTFWFALR